MSDNPDNTNANNTPREPASDSLDDLDMGDLDFSDLDFDDIADELAEDASLSALNTAPRDDVMRTPTTETTAPADVSAPAPDAFDEPFDDEWDEFDEPLPDMPQFDGPAQTAAMAAASMPRRKSFLQKNFNFIVIGLAVLAAIVIFMTQMSKPAQTIVAETQTAPVVPEDSSPTTISTAPIPEDVTIDIAAAPLIPELGENTAPPMPSPVTVPDAPKPLSNVDLSDLAPVTSSTNNAPTISPPEQLEIASWEDMLAEDADKKDIETDASEAAPVQAIEADTLEASPVRAAETQTIQPLLAEAPAASVEPVLVAAPTENAPAPTQTDNDDAIAKAQAEAQLALQKVDAFERMVTNKDAKIKQLETKLKATEAALQSAKKVAAKTTTATKAPAPVKAVPPKTSTKTATPKKATPKRTTVKRSAPKKTQRVQWVLRAAQPNMAVIAPKGTDNLQSIAVGSNVSGLGKIKSIQNINGKWVIQGTIGQLTQ